MKYLLTIFILLLSVHSFATEEQKLLVGKIIKSKHETEGSNYFVLIEKENKKYAYPVNEKSLVRNLDQYENKFVKVYGQTNFQKSKKDESNFVMTIQINKVSEVKVSDLSVTQFKQNTEFDDFMKLQSGTKINKEARDGKITISDKAANTAILVGGAILAAEILGKLR